MYKQRSNLSIGILVGIMVVAFGCLALWGVYQTEKPMKRVPGHHYLTCYGDEWTAVRQYVSDKPFERNEDGSFQVGENLRVFPHGVCELEAVP